MRIGILAIVASGLVSVSGWAAEADREAIAKAIQNLAPQAKIETIRPAPIKDWSEVVLGSQVVYVSNDGRHLFNGSLYETNARTDLTELARGGLRAEALKQLPEAAKISFAPEQPKARVTVFTAIDCGFCRQMHRDIEAYQSRGIAVDYVVIPRSAPGTPGAESTRQLYCATDPSAAFDAAMLDQPVQAPSCPAQGYEAGMAMAQQLSIQSTPTIVFADGSLGLGYLTPDELDRRVDASAKR